MSGGEGGGQKSGSYIYSIGVFATANKEWIHFFLFLSEALLTLCKLLWQHTVFIVYTWFKKTSFEKYKLWTIGPYGFMGRNFISNVNLNFVQKGLHCQSFLQWCSPKKVKQFPVFLVNKLTTSPVHGTSEIFTAKEHSHIVNWHL